MQKKDINRIREKVRNLDPKELVEGFKEWMDTESYKHETLFGYPIKKKYKSIAKNMIPEIESIAKDLYSKFEYKYRVGYHFDEGDEIWEIFYECTLPSEEICDYIDLIEKEKRSKGIRLLIYSFPKVFYENVDYVKLGFEKPPKIISANS
jgi:hypothetical protein